MKCFILNKVYIGEGGINSNTMVCRPVWEIIQLLKLVDYLLIQVDKPWYKYHINIILQIDIVRDEILQGKYNLSSSDISVATNNFINKLLKYLTDQANNTHGYSDFYDQLMDTMTDLQSTLNDQYANILKDW